MVSANVIISASAALVALILTIVVLMRQDGDPTDNFSVTVTGSLSLADGTTALSSDMHYCIGADCQYSAWGQDFPGYYALVGVEDGADTFLTNLSNGQSYKFTDGALVSCTDEDVPLDMAQFHKQVDDLSGAFKGSKTMTSDSASFTIDTYALNSSPSTDAPAVNGHTEPTMAECLALMAAGSERSTDEEDTDGDINVKAAMEDELAEFEAEIEAKLVAALGSEESEDGERKLFGATFEERNFWRHEQTKAGRAEKLEAYKGASEVAKVHEHKRNNDKKAYYAAVKARNDYYYRTLKWWTWQYKTLNYSVKTKWRTYRASDTKYKAALALQLEAKQEAYDEWLSFATDVNAQLADAAEPDLEALAVAAAALEAAVKAEAERLAAAAAALELLRSNRAELRAKTLFDWNRNYAMTGREASDLAAFAYDELAVPAGWTHMGNCITGNAKARFATKAPAVAIVFAGTDDNLGAVMFGGGGMDISSSDVIDDLNTGLHQHYHQGFYNYVRKLKTCVDEQVLNFLEWGKNIDYVVGHSLGGAASVVYHQRSTLEEQDPGTKTGMEYEPDYVLSTADALAGAVVVTFGAPKTTRHTYHAGGGFTDGTRFMMDKDPVASNGAGMLEEFVHDVKNVKRGLNYKKCKKSCRRFFWTWSCITWCSETTTYEWSTMGATSMSANCNTYLACMVNVGDHLLDVYNNQFANAGDIAV